MSDPVDALLLDVRANTQGFAADVQAMRGTFDATLVDGFAKAGDVLERGLLGAIRKGSLGFEDLKRAALGVIDQIAAQAVSSLFAGLGGGKGGGLNLGSLIGSIMGLPGRATGGPVAPDRPYLVGERGPELFMPASAGSIVPGAAQAPRDVRVAITIAAPRGTSAPQALQRSSRQVASAVRRALSDY
ncbi:tail tape measure protein [Parablastomonas sp. CN1-191]|uniref:tail tape measure protein n=1 Tax=Parablastomonas sp. CN1-191 TaxID=3400908 RepID=UPI003BF8BCDF